MKIVVIGGTGLIGANVVGRLRQEGHEVVAASPRTGVDTLSGQGLDRALAGAQAVVDVSNSPSFEAGAVMDFFTTSTRNLLAAEARAGIEHHLILSIVGADRLPDNAYLSAKAAQETLVEASGRPYTILRATQFFEFIGGIVDAGTQDGVARLSPALFQPIAADDVAAVLADLAAGAPLNGILETGGPDRFPLDELARKYLAAQGDGRSVVADVHARYFGSELDDRSLVTGAGARIAPTRFHNWLSRGAAQA
ncbi:NmrA-like family [Bordetella ansorpii]|uniref:NmrA-like family n=1 Tax=Bordetella ansorpii TaxID=288768 RepID=A0A157SUE2_9BORD|nr:SDR family oxidoreductase [Bordetella ansorpii]SAI73951.1 NmrA-like family [Bordetella ansorpii]